MTEPKIVCLDRYSGEFYWTTMKNLERYQREINEKVSQQGHCSYHEYLEIMTRDWPEEVRNRFYETSLKGWMDDYGFTKLNGMDSIEFAITNRKDATGLEYFAFDFDAKLWKA